ncbi:MAG: LicD family protein [Oscillibacter sp.]|nr:LicD family protein [Oscillibacter sp.]
MQISEMDIRSYQSVLLGMMKDLARICEENGLTYYLVGGSALGAVRERGFIPWDNDMDVALPRPDYEKLIRIAPEVLPAPYEMRYRKNACVYHFLRNDMLVDTSKFNDAGFGSVTHPYIDVDPIDGAPHNAVFRFLRESKILLYTYLHKFACIDMTVEHPDRSGLEIFVIRLAKLLHTNRFLSAGRTGKRWIREARKTEYGKTDWVVIAFGSYKYRDVFPLAWVGDGVKVPFEGESFRIFSDCDKYLRQLYGNYEIPVKRGY